MSTPRSKYTKSSSHGSATYTKLSITDRSDGSYDVDGIADKGNVAVNITTSATDESKKEWHLISEDQLLVELGTSRSGLTSAQHLNILNECGLNDITSAKKHNIVVQFMWNLVSGFQLMLWIGAVMCFIVFTLSNVSTTS